MSEQAAIEKSSCPVTVDMLCTGLKSLGIRQGDVVIVHSSMSALGWVCGEQAAVVSALITAVGAEGTLVMPAHTTSNSDPAQWQHPPVPAEWVETIRQTMPAFEKEITPSRGVGKIAECFRTYPGTLRSDHPHVSFTARGSLAKQITARHALTPFFGMDTPLGALYRLNAKILLLGVDYSRCTAFHLAEALTQRLPVVQMGCAMTENNNRVWKTFQDYDYDGEDFAAIGMAYEKTAPVITGTIGSATCKLFHTKPSVDFAKDWLMKK